ncbi:hypothetical protein [Streptomyces phytohabitans]|uniref:hypothetical protein n=1 Tax=Streptomyces phytohabitans TaxID=1150371 RepID=UPI00345BAE22
MSTQESPEQPRERRRRLTVLSVAAAVLLAGGGGAYLAANASDDDGGSSAADGGSPEPLVLDGAGRTEAGGGDGGRSGVAPGEPDPGGTAKYRAAGELPDGPDSASVHRRADDVDKDEVAGIAKALDVPGTPKLENGRWTIAGGKDEPSLSVGSDSAPGMWTYTRQPDLIDTSCGTDHGKGGGKLPGHQKCAQPGEGSADDAVPSDGTEPVSEAKAKEAVKPLLEALDISDAKLDATSAYGSVRVVDARPEVDGLPTHDWGGKFTVGPDGEVARAHGQLGELDKGTEYPVMSAEETLKQLNEYGGPTTLEARCATPPQAKKPGGGSETKPAPGGPSEDVPCGPGTGKPLAVTGAEFGLATQFSKGQPVLVPSWIYEVQRPGGEETYPVAFPAVQPKFLERGDGDDGTAEPPSTGGGAEKSKALSSYEADGRTLTVTFWGGVCHKHAVKADESGDKVTVTVEERERDPEKKACVMVAKKQTVEVTLDKALGDREVVDARKGAPLPEK